MFVEVMFEHSMCSLEVDMAIQVSDKFNFCDWAMGSRGSDSAISD